MTPTIWLVITWALSVSEGTHEFLQYYKEVASIEACTDEMRAAMHSQVDYFAALKDGDGKMYDDYNLKFECIYKVPFKDGP